jgi:hypothetical protein
MTTLGDDLRRQLRRVRRRTDRKPRAHMIHIGKTGGTALKDTLHPVAHAGRYQIRTHPHTVRLSSIPEGDKVFFVIRDPLERYVSGFNSRLRCGRPTHNSPWNDGERAAFTEFPTPDSLGIALSSDDVAVRARAFTAMTAIRHVRDSYWDWLGPREYFQSRVDDMLMIIWCPDLTPTFPRLREALGLPTTVELPSDELKSHRAPSGLDKHLSDVARENLERWYGREFAAVDLCASLPCFMGPSRQSVDVTPAAI